MRKVALCILGGLLVLLVVAVWGLDRYLAAWEEWP